MIVEMPVFMIITTVSIAVLICVLTVIFSIRYVQKMFTSVDQVLDRVLSKNIVFAKETIEDDRISKLTHKAERVTGVYVSDAEKITSEKNTIQSFISDMSHQMKTPLAGISMYSSLLQEGNLSEDEQREFLSRIQTGTEKLQWMMDCLIKMSRLEAGAVQLSPENTSIKQTIADSIESILSQAENKNITVAVEKFKDIPLYHDKKWTREVFSNILENAVKYSHNGGSIEISLEPLTLYTKITVTDHGIGIDKNEWNSVFKRFYRGKNTESFDGSGLGLYLASLIMEKQGGYIMVDSQPNQYTSFSLFLQNCKK